MKIDSKYHQKNKEYYQKNKERILREFREYRKNHKEEIKKRNIKYRNEHREEIKEKLKKYYQKNKKEMNEKAKEYYQLNKNKLLPYYRRKSRERDEKIKYLIFEHYGTVCSCCGENNFKFLSIDHINNDGNRHRKEIKSKGGSHFYAWLLKNNFPNGFQVLCFNCNFAKGLYGQCPHKHL